MDKGRISFMLMICISCNLGNVHNRETFQGWVCTGRRWSFVVGAAFLLSAQAFFYLIDVNDARWP